ncbi:MAG: FAD-dependent thymidylate synthase [Dehalococcoidales bacterium]|nr:FAD-dependent thymidylate synthase [Dehalococcoidales bacterium]
MDDSYNIEVKLLALTEPSGLLTDIPLQERGSKPGEEVIEFAGRLCWDTTHKLGTDPDRIQKWIKSGHESVIEHASATFLIKASRVLTHELVRHRLASYSQRSQRYVRENEPRYITPPELVISAQSQQGAENPVAVFEKAMLDAWTAYRKLLNSGVKPEIARYVLPNACETQIVMTMNFRELRNFIKLRTSARALPEMRAVAGKVLKIMKQEAPRVFGDL